MKIHDLKTHQSYFMQVVTGKKKFEVRKNDRDFQKGDVLHLQNYDGKENKYLFGYALAEVDYVLQGGQFGIEQGYCVMSITVLRSEY